MIEEGAVFMHSAYARARDDGLRSGAVADWSAKQVHAALATLCFTS